MIVVLLSCAVFAAGVGVLYGLHGPVRTFVLAASFAVLIGIAVRQTLVRSKKK